MKNRSLLRAVACAWVLIVPTGARAQQDVRITGVVSDERGNPLPGAYVFIEMTYFGAATDVHGTYTFTVPARTVTELTAKLTARAAGYRSRTENILPLSGTVTQDFALPQDALNIDAVIVTGVIDGTPKTKMPFSAAVVTDENLERVPATSPESALYGKVAGLKVVKGNGQPGESASVLLRGPTSINASGRSQDPLYIVDGAIIDPSISGSPLTDIPADDIENIQVIKGAAAASIYGSRGANGVIRVTTKRGRHLGLNQTRVVVRTEVGFSTLTSKIKLSQHHGYKMADSSYTDGNGMDVTPGDFIDRDDNWVDPRLSGGRLPDDYLDPVAVPHAAGIAFHDNPYKYVATGDIGDSLLTLGEPFDQIGRFFDRGTFLSNTISVSRNMETGNFLLGFGNRTESGVVTGIDGLNRKNIRLILDHRIRQSLFLSVSGLYSRSERDLVAQSFGPFFALTFMAADADITARGDDGELFIQPDPNSVEDNPLYFIENNDRDDTRSRILGSVGLRWDPSAWFHVEGNLSFDRSDRETELFWPVGYLSFVPIPETSGRFVKSTAVDEAWNGSVTASFGRRFGDLAFRARGQGLFERGEFDFTRAEGLDALVAGARNLGLYANHSVNSEFREIRSNSYSITTAFDYKDRYMADLHIRLDGCSLFGEDNRWQTYYRAAAAYRISQEPWWVIPGFDEFKLRAAYGTAGSRPNFFSRFETLTPSFDKENLGNPKLKPELAKELALGVDIAFLKRLTVELTYTRADIEDQILFTPLPGFAGFTNVWRNAGTLETTTFEATFNALILGTRDVHWRVGFNFDKIRQRIATLDVPSYRQGPFLITEGEELGAIYGDEWIKNTDDLPAEVPQDQFNVNDDGYVVWVGENNTFRDGIAKELWGTQTTLTDQYGVEHAYRWGMPIKFKEAELDSNGSFVSYTEFVRLGSTAPDFNRRFYSDFRWKGLSVYAVFDAQIGGDIYNNTNQWGLRDLNLGEVDQFGKPDELKKPGEYYTTLYDVNSVNSHFVEDGTYLKLRELSVTYTFDRRALSGIFQGFFKRLSVGIVGRNLLTFTDYQGYDPEVGIADFGFGSAVLARYDAFGYPNFRTLSGVIEFEF